ncbi:MAG TPA: MarR family transcriptional regulator [Thermoanaerobacterales bacterium]|nr:MarR family transcriptional regulator [Thermoanaerobacterales bacterium]
MNGLERLKRMAESYNWVEGIASRAILEFKRTHEMLEEVFENYFQEYDISDSKFNLLVILYNSSEKGLMLSEIGDRMLVTKANITGLIDRLERQGLVKRIRDESDRRKIQAVITRKGIEFTEEVIKKYKEWSGSIMNILNDDEKSMLIKIMAKLQKGLVRMETERRIPHVTA